MIGQAGWEEAFKTTLGEILREIRRERALSQEALAEASAVSVNHISLMERGLTTPTVLLLFQVAKALQISPTEIVRRVEVRITALETADGPSSR